MEMPAATQEIFERESKDFVADIELFFEAESQPSTSTPIGFEVSFGRPLEDSVEALARPEAVEIDLGEGLLIRIAGRVDRIDKLSDTTFEVLDYKTESYYPPGWQGVFSKGRRLQHALYGLAAVDLLRAHYKRPKVEAGAYYFPTHKGRQQRPAIATSWRNRQPHGRISGQQHRPVSRPSRAPVYDEGPDLGDVFKWIGASRSGCQLPRLLR